MQKNKRRIIKEDEERRNTDPKETAVKKLEFIICKSLNGNMSTGNIAKLFEIQQEIDDGTATDDEIMQEIDKLYAKVK